MYLVQTLAWNETIQWGITSGRTLAGHAHGNAFSLYSGISITAYDKIFI